jgi:dCMP deaminase
MHLLAELGAKLTEDYAGPRTTNRPDWDQYFLSMAPLAATRSKDRSTRVGAVIVDVNHSVIATGYNGFARGIDDNIDSRHERPAKYLWTAHAEENAILSAARLGHATEGAFLYCTHAPCSRCARGIIQAGVTRVYYPISTVIATMTDDINLGLDMLDEAHVGRWPINV